MVALQTYDWPGNVRQLRNAVERLLIMAPGDPSETIRGDMLPPDIGAIAPTTPHSQNGLEIMSMPLREAREAFERQYLPDRRIRGNGAICLAPQIEVTGLGCLRPAAMSMHHRP
jgi:two-component system nitrogen regulation response regulator NtrX